MAAVRSLNLFATPNLKLFVPIFFLLYFFFFGGNVDAAILKTITTQDLEAATRINEHLLVVFVSKDCPSCREAEMELSKLTTRDDVSLQVTVVRIVDSELPKKVYGRTSTAEPIVVFYRHRNALVYDGKIESSVVDEWITYNHESALKILNDDTFEHLTQAGTGATTGDWLVIFCDVTIESCLRFQHVYEAVAARLKGRHNVAFVDTSKNPGLVKRFSILKPLTIIFFRLGKMYEYSLDKIDVASLVAFPVNFYSNVKAVNIPVELAPFDLLTENIAKHLQENSSTVLSLVALPVLIVAIVFWMLRRGSKTRKNE